MIDLRTIPPDLELTLENCEWLAKEGFAMTEVIFITGWDTSVLANFMKDNNIRFPKYTQKQLNERDIRSVHYHMGLGCSSETFDLIRGKWA